MLNQVENPMVNDAHWWKRPPEIVCPLCGSEWHTPEDTPGRDGVLSASGQYCIECLEGEKGTKEALLEWYEQDIDDGDLMAYWFGDAYGVRFNRDDTAATTLLELMREHAPDTFLELLHDYSRIDTGNRHSAWLEYLKEKN